MINSVYTHDGLFVRLEDFAGCPVSDEIAIKYIKINQKIIWDCIESLANTEIFTGLMSAHDDTIRGLKLYGTLKQQNCESLVCTIELSTIIEKQQRALRTVNAYMSV